jgi:hypothetical protein
LSNRYSTIDRRNAPNEQGNRKTGREFAKESKQMGFDRYFQKKQERADNAAKREQKKKDKEQAEWKSQIQGMSKNRQVTASPKRYDGGIPLGANVKGKSQGHVENLKSSQIERIGSDLQANAQKTQDGTRTQG